MRRIPLSRLTAVAILVAAGACSTDGPTSAIGDRSPTTAAAYIDGSGISPDPTQGGFRTAGVPDVELFEVCKRWVGNPGVATFEVYDGLTTNTTSTDDGTWVSGVSAQGHNDWSCRDVYIIGGSGTTVRVTETGTSGGSYTLTDISALVMSGNPAATIGADYAQGLLAGTPGAGVTAFFTNTENPQTGCSLTWGYWKTHSAYGPAPYDATWALQGEDTPFFLSGTTWYGVLQIEPRGNAYYQLAHQYVAAYLNSLNGADVSAISAELTAAANLLNAYTPAQVGAWRGQRGERGAFVSIAGTLASYNEGDIGPGHCDD